VLKALSDYRVEEVKVDPFGARVAYAEDYRNGGEREADGVGPHPLARCSPKTRRGREGERKEKEREGRESKGREGTRVERG